MSAGDVAAEFIDNQLAYLRERRASIETRAISLITIAALPAPIAAAFVTLTAPGKAIKGPALAGAVVAVAALAMAAVCGVKAMAPRKTSDLVDTTVLRRLISADLWDRPPENARRAIAVAQLEMTDATEKVVSRKGTWLRGGFALAVLGLLVLAVTVLLVTRGP
ncbi:MULTISPECIES: hypothetical protein [unclassified Streptomyces]|uniref:hypothetical protein n=1 Tax=unclassified Streptomyces TaxID=2593676 RepID=UPI000DC76F80|nr:MULTISPECIES: hypothetical protein [unclassified Streptomyces]AWZ05634.1 hypothetical protein DRB89_14295 [Streptomyces sp. ICC4]AWZ13314.1 hypothetical protein DRB96_14425 [Streptomyces sp. ICC1]